VCGSALLPTGSGSFALHLQRVARERAPCRCGEPDRGFSEKLSDGIDWDLGSGFLHWVKGVNFSLNAAGLGPLDAEWLNQHQSSRPRIWGRRYYRMVLVGVRVFRS